MCQVCIAAACGSKPSASPAVYEGPKTNKTIPMLLGVSNPSGIAVTLVNPVRRA